MSNILKTLIAYSLIDDTKKKIDNMQISEEEASLSYNVKANNRKEKNVSLLDLLSNKDTVIAADLLIKGYTLVKLGDDYIVFNNKGKQYQICGDQCTCPDFVVGRSNSSRCKHLIFRDWHLQYQQRSTELKNQLD